MAELYSLPDGWEWKPLISLTEVFSDGNWIESKDQSDDGIRLIQTGNIGIGIFKDREDKSRFISESTFERLNCTEIYENDCLISRLPEPVGRSCLIPKMDLKLITSVDCTIVRFKESVLPKLFVYYSQSNYYFNMIMNNATGATRLRISKKNLSNIPIPLPPLEEQKRIVAKLDILFAKIDKAIALHQKNIDEADIFMASVLNDVFVELEEKYEKKQLNQIVIFGGKNISTLEYPNLIYFSLEDIETQTGKILNYKTVNESRVKGTAVSFDDNVVLYSKLRPYLNKVIVPNLEGCATTELVVLKPKDKLDKYFLASYLRSSNIVSFLNNDSMGAKMPRTNMKTFRNLDIPLPPLQNQQKVVAYLDEISNKMEKIKQIQKEKMQSLKELKASILDKAFKGEL
ncbi:restriction endonuclease subunit S [Aliarcobacter cryaerophilus]|uniref:restriction endonuclease subunit S n=1 Tax=Aliarcobacter cryaerophilus TaxID=28198 RepID=UPI0021B4C6DF|nr:restriction endonuclease subunit S [Aliarcobacter cryaerophilus]MCT7498747.1 restriction endonuclease subunit S [Aliarcobacter cryaerophilus]MCT7543957.1 restriction endonuclease subunit S [Aliarcobacter cryaerophilus]